MNDSLRFANVTATLPLTTTQIVVYVMVSITALISIFSALLNLLVIIVFARNPQVRNTFNFYLLNLAVIDFILSVLDMPFNVAGTFNGSWPFGASFCDVFLYIDYVFTSGTTNAVLVISLDRLVAVYSREHRSPRVTYVVLVVMWVYLHVLLVPYVAIDRHMTVWTDDNAACYVDLPSQRSYGLVVQFVAYWVPLVLVALSYILIWIKLFLRQKQKVTPSYGEGGTSAVVSTYQSTAGATNSNAEVSAKRKHRKDRRLYMALSWLTFSVVICWTPVDVYFTLGIFSDDYKNDVVYAVVTCLQYGTCLMNPIAFHHNIPEIKDAMKRIMHCG